MEADNKNISHTTPKNPEFISFFEKDSAFVFVYKKTEKLASAMYIVTNLFSDSEPMKWTLRKKVSDLVSFTLTYKDIRESNHADFVYNIKSKVLELISLLEVSFRGGLVSHMNFNILKQEFSNLLEVFNTPNTIQKENANESIPDAFFDVPGSAHTSHGYVSTGNIQRTSHTYIKDNSTSESTQGHDQFKRTNRQTIILNLLKKKKELTIKDISVVIKDCSEKTIQRELIAFITAGVLKRTGERRWSRYSLV